VITIRPALPTDRRALEQCFCELQAFERAIEPNRAAPEKVCRPYLDELLADCTQQAGTILVAEDAGQVVGFVCVLARVPSDEIVELEREFAYITDLVVLELYRQRGIGSQLIAAAEQYARSHGATRMRIGVLAANNAAHRLYQQLGYRDSEIVLERSIPRTLPPQERGISLP
jgi:ribosomal protein S18 acetylase RimI-like enzyme